jgi:hypothetical protein
MGKVISESLAKRDDPIFSGGAQSFYIRRPKKSTGATPEDIERIGREASAGMRAQSNGGDPTAVVEEMRARERSKLAEEK